MKLKKYYLLYKYGGFDPDSYINYQGKVTNDIDCAQFFKTFDEAQSVRNELIESGMSSFKVISIRVPE